MNTPPGRDLSPLIDDHARDVLDDAAETLGLLRGYPGAALNDPAVHLHLLASLHLQLRADLLLAAHIAYDHGHTIDELAALLDDPPT